MKMRIDKVAAFTLLIVLAVLMATVLVQVPSTSDSPDTQGRIDYLLQGDGSPKFVLAFYDWYDEPQEINGEKWTHKVDWEQFGLRVDEIGTSDRYYDQQMDMIKDLGVDGIAYEFFRHQNGEYLLPSASFLKALERNDLEIGPFFDWEITKVRGKPVLSEEPYIYPQEEVLDGVIKDIRAFYDLVPPPLRLRDSCGNVLIWFYAFGFPRDHTAWEEWRFFYSELISRLESYLGEPVVIYWTSINAPQLEYAFQHFPHKIKPFNFVLDVPQHAFDHSSVTWNIVYDNLGVWCYHKLLRVIRDDERYIAEPLWMALYTRPSVVFIYGWNEYFEGANLMPDKTFGFSRYNLVRGMIREVRDCRGCDEYLKTVAIVIDDWSHGWGDWHIEVQREFLLYSLRRLLPQADTFTVGAVDWSRLSDYDVIFSLQRSDNSFDDFLAEQADRGKVVIYLNPTTDLSDKIVQLFAKGVRRLPYNDEALVKGQPIFVRDDVLLLDVKEDVDVLLEVELSKLRIAVPILLKRSNVYWHNYYWPHDVVLEELFEDVYGRPLEQSILFGQGMRSQRLEVSADGEVRQNTFSAPAAIEHPPLPIDLVIPTPVIENPCFSEGGR